MDGILALFQRLWVSLVLAVGGEAVAIIVVVGFAAAMTALYVVVRSFQKTEFYKQHKAMLELVDDRIADLIWMVEFSDVDLTPYQQRADQRAQEGLSYIDPRMLFLLDKAQDYVKDKFGQDLDFEFLLGRAEHIFDEVKNSDTNSVGGKPVKVVVNSPTGTSQEIVK